MVRNVPLRREGNQGDRPGTVRSHYKIIYQGALNLGRGLELLIRSMHFLEDVRLILAGSGDIEDDLKDLVKEMDLGEKIKFTGRMSPDELKPITCGCDLGVSLEEDMGLNYRFALPNKIFDYIQCRIPVLCSDLPEMANLVNKYGAGAVVKERNPEKLASQISAMLELSRKGRWDKSLEKAAGELCWEKEVRHYLDVVEKSLNNR